MGEGREGEAAFRFEKAIARFPHPNPPPGGGGGMMFDYSSAIALQSGRMSYTRATMKMRLNGRKAVRCGSSSASRSGRERSLFLYAFFMARPPNPSRGLTALVAILMP